MLTDFGYDVTVMISSAENLCDKGTGYGHPKSIKKKAVIPEVSRPFVLL